MNVLQNLRSPVITRPLAVILIVTVIGLPRYSTADAISQGAEQGRQVGQQAVPNPGVAIADSEGNITLFPNSEKPLRIEVNELFPGATGDYQPYASVYGDDKAMTDMGQAAQKTLETDPGQTGEAYRVLKGTGSLARPSMENDPLWKTTDQTLGQLDTLTSEFADCTKTSETVSGTIQSHVPDYRTCERVSKRRLQCSLNHQVSVQSQVIRINAGGYISRRVTVVLDWKTGAVSKDPAASDGGAYAYGNVSPTVDYQALCGSADRAYNYQALGTWDWDPRYSYPDWDPEWGGAPSMPYDASFTWTLVQAPNCANGFVQKIRIDDVGGSAWYFSGIEQQVNLWRKTQDAWEWSSSECENLASDMGSGSCGGTLQCDRNNSDCMEVNGVRLCGSELVAAPLSGVKNGCEAASIDAMCDASTGVLGCYDDIRGVRRCPVNGGGVESCAPLEANPNCGFISSRCVDGAQTPDGGCLVTEEVWDCGIDTSIPTATSRASIQCAGPIRCMGAECANPVPENSSDLAHAAVSLQLAQFIGQDASCDKQADQGGTHGDARLCAVFNGQGYECKKAVGGIVDCCQSPGGVSLAQYMDLLFAMNKLDNAVMAMDANSMVRGSWEVLREPVVDAWSTASNWFSSAWNSISGSTSAVSDVALDSTVSSFKQDLVNASAEWVADTFGQGTADLFFQTGASGATELGGTAGTAMGWIMTAYMYYSIFILAVNLIWECEQKEFELGAKRELKLCHHVGSYCASAVLGSCVEKRESYCCFNSPLSRIVQEQVRPQLGLSWGSSENPSCSGITIEQLQKIDWSKINLDEWLAILNMTGHLPKPGSLGMEQLTGSGNALNIYGNRETAAERAVNRVEGLDTTDIRQEAGEELRGR